MPSDMEFVTYKEFIENLPSAESLGDADAAVVSNLTDGPRAFFLSNLPGSTGIINGGTLTDGALVNVQNNSVSRLTTSQSSLILSVSCVPGEIPNFAVEITTTAAVTVSVRKAVIGNGAAVAIELNYSAAGGNELESGKMYQLTCVGSCWTVAEFVDPSAQQQSASVLSSGLQSPGGGTSNTLAVSNESPLLGDDVSLQTTEEPVESGEVAESEVQQPEELQEPSEESGEPVQGESV